MREARLRPLVLVLRGATADLRWTMSSPSRGLVGEPSRSGLGSTGETPSKGGGNPTLGETDDNIHWGGR